MLNLANSCNADEGKITKMKILVLYIEYLNHHTFISLVNVIFAKKGWRVSFV